MGLTTKEIDDWADSYRLIMKDLNRHVPEGLSDKELYKRINDVADGMGVTMDEMLNILYGIKAKRDGHQSDTSG